MNKTDLLEIKKLFKYPDCHFSKVGFCIVKSLEYDLEPPHERIDFTGETKFLTRDIEEQKSFSSLLSKAYCFQEGVLSCDIDVDGDLKRLLSSFAFSNSNDVLNIEPFAEELIKSYPYIKSYALVFFKGAYDVMEKDTSKTKTGESEEVYEYISVMLCPIEASKVGLTPIDGNIVRSDVVRILKQPLFGLIYPSFCDRQSDDTKAFVCCRKDAERELVNNLFEKDLEAPPKKEKASIRNPIQTENSDALTLNSPIPAAPGESDTMGSLYSYNEEYISKTHNDTGVLPAEIGSAANVKGSSYNDEPYVPYESSVNNIDNALLKKRHDLSSNNDDEFEQKIEVKEDKSRISHNKVTERDIDGKKFFIIPRELLPDDILEKILSLEQEM